MPKTADLSEFESEEARVGGRPCLFCNLVASLPADQRDKLNAALEAEHLRPTAIIRVLERWGHGVSEYVVRRHRPFGDLPQCRVRFPGGRK